MNKGFTLVELLAVILILAIISTIAIFSINGIISNSKNSLSKSQKKSIEAAAKIYYLKEGIDNEFNTDEPFEYACVNLSELISKGYIDATSVIDPKSGNPFSGSVKISYAGNQYNYEYQSIVCHAE